MLFESPLSFLVSSGLFDKTILLAEVPIHAGTEVPGWVMGFFTVVLVLMVLALAFEEKIHAKKSIIVGTFAGFCLITETVISYFLGEKLVPFGMIVLPNGHEIDIPVYIPAIDWGVITIILGASLFVEVTSKSGVFSWMAIKLTKTSGGDPWRLLIFYGLLTVGFSAVLNNVTAMIIIGSLTTVSLKKLNRNDLLLGFLLTEGLLTNVGGLLTLISSVPNIIVGKIAGISFATFFIKAAPYVVVATAATLLLARWKFKIHALSSEKEKAAAAELIESFDENEGVASNRFFWFAVAVLALFICTLAGESALPWYLNKLGMGFIALFFAGWMLLAYKNQVDKFYSGMDWDLLAFFAALFVVINVMEHALVLDLIGKGIAMVLEAPQQMASSVLLASAALASSVTDNIPLSAVLAKILNSMQTESTSPYWWCVIFGSNLGGNLTPIGSASTVVAMTIINRQKLGLTFMGFVKQAFPFAAMQVVLAVFYVLLFI